MEITKQTKIGVLCGGISSEREISLRSGSNCFNAFNRLGYKNTLLVDIKSVEDLFKLKDKIEIAFLVTHGKYGEDGSLQGILEWLKIPYTGSSVTGSAISMDKWLTKQIATSNAILNPKAYLLKKSNETSLDLKTIWNELSHKHKAIFLKPRGDGSSVNTYKIKSLSELEDKLHNINLDEADYLIEEYISGRELTVSILEIENRFKALPILELKPKNEFYDYAAKYTKGMTEFILPAKLDLQTIQKIEDISIKIFSSVGCSSFGRVDYILDKDNNAYLLEINSLPGMTDTSDLPAQAAHAGIKYDELVEIILKTAKLHK
ncbi:MAG: D-alanine--D-alanine ligase [Candidatus Melainabacteria bacterium]|nr:D-alanine--D-alanine ligase [Candidatus Melainabacteria bacterium]